MSSRPTIDDRTAATIRSALAAARANRLDEACAIGKQGLANGGDPTALHAMIGALLCSVGNFELAITHLCAARDAKPLDPIIAGNLGAAFTEGSRYRDALDVTTEHLAETDSTMRLYKIRGFAAQMLEEYSTAIAAYERVIAAAPQDWESWNNLGNTKVSAGNFHGGIAALRRATELNPHAAPTRLNLARTLRQVGEVGEAAILLRLMAKDFPADPKPLVDLADMLRTDLGDDEGARRALEGAVGRDPLNAGLLINLGRQQLITLAADAAETSFRRALELEPNNPDVFLGLAEVLEHLRPKELPELTAQAQAAQIGQSPLAFLKALTARREKRYEAGVAALRLVPKNFQPELRWQLEGQLLDGAGRHDEAFEAFSQMNAVQAEDPSKPLQRAAELRERLRERLQGTTAAWRKSWAALPTPTIRPDPVFLLGFPRSGTTLLDTMLMGHPQIEVLEERPIWARVEAESGGFGSIAAMGEKQVSRTRQRYFELAAEFAKIGDGSILIDKSPLHMQRVPQIVRFFPNAKFILALRHPADVVLSCFMANFRLNSSMANFLRLDTAAEFYNLSFNLWTRALDLFPVDVHTVVYENMIGDPEAVLKPLVKALGLKWHPEMLDHQITAHERGIVSTASYAQVTQPLYRQAVGRWKGYRRHLEPILPTLQPWIEKFGYEVKV